MFEDTVDEAKLLDWLEDETDDLIEEDADEDDAVDMLDEVDDVTGNSRNLLNWILLKILKPWLFSCFFLLYPSFLNLSFINLAMHIP